MFRKTPHGRKQRAASVVFSVGVYTAHGRVNGDRRKSSAKDTGNTARGGAVACRLTIVGYILHDHNVCAEDGEHSQSTGNVCTCMCKGIKRAKMCVRKTTRRVKVRGGTCTGKTLAYIIIIIIASAMCRNTCE